MKIKIKRGFDLPLAGGIPASTATCRDVVSPSVAIYPGDFEGFQPKAMVRPGQRVVAGEAVLYHKDDERIKLVSPVSGIIQDVVRGERRRILSVIISCDGTDEHLHTDGDLTKREVGPQEAITILAEAGLLALIRQRPFHIIPDADIRPRDIFITSFDSSPLAVNRNWKDPEVMTALQAGASFLSNITTGEIYISQRGDAFPELRNVRNVVVEGPHPAGLPGIQIANIKPVNKGETVWTLSAETLWRIGRLVTNGIFESTAYVTVCGERVRAPYIARTVIGAKLSSLLDGEIVAEEKHFRVISGNVLTGIKSELENGYIHYPYTQVTVIDEGDQNDEFMGWASLSPKKLSMSPSYPGRFLRKLFNVDARMGGGQRAIIMSGEYDRMLPMDIYGEYLIKAIRSRNIEQMERLGIYEVAPEDFALAEFLDSSKLPLQKIVREGLDYLRRELK